MKSNAQATHHTPSYETERSLACLLQEGMARRVQGRQMLARQMLKFRPLTKMIHPALRDSGVKL